MSISVLFFRSIHSTIEFVVNSTWKSYFHNYPLRMVNETFCDSKTIIYRVQLLLLSCLWVSILFEVLDFSFGFIVPYGEILTGSGSFNFWRPLQFFLLGRILYLVVIWWISYSSFYCQKDLLQLDWEKYSTSTFVRKRILPSV